MLRLEGIPRLLFAGRDEIAIRVFGAAHALGVRRFAVYAEEDGRSLHRFETDERYYTWKGRGSAGAYPC